MTTIVLIGSHAAFREALAEVLASSPGFSVLGQTGAASEAIPLCVAKRPTIVVLDLELSDCTGTEILKRLRKALPQGRVLLHSATLDPVVIQQALRLAPGGFVHKTESLSRFRQALTTVASGGRFLSPLVRELGDVSVSCIESEALSSREVEVVQLVAAAKSSKEIAAILAISVRTVENHRASIMRKLAVRDAVSIVRYAFRSGLMQCAEGQPCPLRHGKGGGVLAGVPVGRR